MRRHAQGFVTPVRQTIKRADAEPTKARVVSALGCFQPPIEILLRSGRVQIVVQRAVVRFLINYQTIRTGGDERTIFFGFHRSDFQRDAGDFFVQRRNAFSQVTAGDKFRMFACDEKDVAKTLCRQRARLAHDFVHGKRDAQNGIVARESAILAVVDALVGKIKRREESNHFPEPLPGERLGASAQVFEHISGCGGNQLGEVRQGKFILCQRFAGGRKACPKRSLNKRFERQGIKFSNKAHAHHSTKAPGEVERRSEVRAWIPR